MDNRLTGEAEAERNPADPKYQFHRVHDPRRDSGVMKVPKNGKWRTALTSPRKTD